MISIRRIRIGESDLFKRIRLASLQEAPYAFTSTYESATRRSAESWREQADNSARGSDRATFLVFSDNAPIGIAALYRLPDETEAGEMIQVWINPEHRRKHIGLKLMDSVFHWARENRFRIVKVKIIKGNNGALGFYKKFGFAIVDEGSTDGIDEMALQREVKL
jgi:RimJ/RimL family protein N-acetyltransferase